jgi:hypothetical protein
MNLGMFNGREVAVEPTDDGRHLFVEARGNFEHPAQITLSLEMEERLLKFLMERKTERETQRPVCGKPVYTERGEFDPPCVLKRGHTTPCSIVPMKNTDIRRRTS